MATPNKFKHSLTAAALATLIAVSGTPAAFASGYGPDNNNGSNTSQPAERKNSVAAKSESTDTKNKNIDRYTKRQADKRIAANKEYRAEQKEALEELKATKTLIMKTFKDAVKKANSEFKAVAESLEVTEEQLASADAVRKAAIKEALKAKETSMRALKQEARKYSKEFKTHSPKF